jgi:hypothetical protein
VAAIGERFSSAIEIELAGAAYGPMPRLQPNLVERATAEREAKGSPAPNRTD